MKLPTEIWMCENEQARWFEFKQPHDLPNDVTVTKMVPQRTWVGLDPEEIRKTNHHMVEGAYHYSFKQGAEWAEAKLKEKNT